MWKVLILSVCLEIAIGQDFSRTYPLRGGSSPSAEERLYLKPQPLVLRDWTKDGSSRDASAVSNSNPAGLFWPFERVPNGLGFQSSDFNLPRTLEIPQNDLSPLKNTNYYQNINLDSDLESQFPSVVRPESVRGRPYASYRPRPTTLLDPALINYPGPTGHTFTNPSPTPYINYNPRRNRIPRPNYFNPRGINYAPKFNNYIPITRFHHESRPERGEYNVAFETANGIAQKEIGYLKTVPVFNERLGRYEHGTGSVKEGSVSWTSPEGIPFSYEYTADENGFRPRGAHIPPLTSVQPAAAAASALVTGYDLNYKPVMRYSPIRLDY